MTLLRRILIALALALLGFAPPVRAADSWDDVVHAAQGKKVYWNAWAGDASVNAYIAWAADEVRRRFGIELHVRDELRLDRFTETVEELGRERLLSVDRVGVSDELQQPLGAHLTQFRHGQTIHKIVNRHKCCGQPTSVVKRPER